MYCSLRTAQCIELMHINVLFVLISNECVNGGFFRTGRQRAYRHWKCLVILTLEIRYFVDFVVAKASKLLRNLYSLCKARNIAVLGQWLPFYVGKRIGTVPSSGNKQESTNQQTDKCFGCV